MDKEISVSVGQIEKRILIIRGQKVMIDADLAALYGVSTKALNQQVRRNIARFPSDFMFQLTPVEKDEVVTICDHLAKLKYSAVLPHAFTEHGAIMIASVLNTKRAIDVSVLVVRAFIKLREFILSHSQMASKLNELETNIVVHDKAIKSLFDSIRRLMKQPDAEKKITGFGIPGKR